MLSTSSAFMSRLQMTGLSDWAARAAIPPVLAFQPTRVSQSTFIECLTLTLALEVSLHSVYMLSLPSSNSGWMGKALAGLPHSIRCRNKPGAETSVN